MIKFEIDRDGYICVTSIHMTYPRKFAVIHKGRFTFTRKDILELKEIYPKCNKTYDWLLDNYSLILEEIQKEFPGVVEAYVKNII